MLSFFLSTEDETYMRVTKKVNYVINSWEGIIQNWWEGLSSEAQAINRGNIESDFDIDDKTGLECVMNGLFTEFLGENWLEDIDRESKREREDARNKLINLSICSMKFIKNYICEFGTYYYTQYYSNESQDIYLQMFYSKLPPPWNVHFSKLWEKEQDNYPKTFGGRIRLLERELSRICTQYATFKRSRKISELYCDTYDKPNQWGCKKEYQKRKSSKEKFSRKRYKKYKKFSKKNIKPKRRYFKRKPYNKNKFDKKKCTCWNCGEEGHKSPECTKPKKVRNIFAEFCELRDELIEISDIENYSGEEIYIEESSSEDNISDSE